MMIYLTTECATHLALKHLHITNHDHTVLQKMKNVGNFKKVHTV